MAPAVVRLLGPAAIGDAPVQAGRVSALLALLAVAGRAGLSGDRLLDELWGDEPPVTGVAAVYVLVSRLRRALEPSGLTVVARPPGYALEAPTDLALLEQAVARAESAFAAGRWDDAVAAGREAVTLWRGRPFAGSAPAPTLDREAERLGRLHRRSRSLLAEALLEAGSAEESATLAYALLDDEPLDEPAAAVLVRALAASGRRDAALDVVDGVRRALRDELGLDLGADLRSLRAGLLALDGPAPAAGEGPVAGSTPVIPTPADLVDRDEEAALLREVVGGLGRAVVFEGEAGIGKTRLAEYAAELARARGARVVWARASDGPGAPPLWVWEQALADLSRAHDDDPRTGAEIIAALTGDTDDATRRFRLHEAIVLRVLQAARREPLLLVLDDLQWADDGGLAVLQQLVQSIRSRPLAVVATVRTGLARSLSVDAVLAAVAREEVAERRTLRPLSLDGVRRFLENRGLGGPGSAASVLLDRSGGNPLYLSELAATGGSPGPVTVPVTVAELTAERLVALPEESAGLVRVAALAARRLDVPVLAHALGVTPLSATALLQPAVDDGIVTLDGGTPSFAHDLVRDAIAALVPLAEQASWHARLGEAIATVHAEDPERHADELADHLFRAAAGQPSPGAVEACLRAADASEARLAYDQAALHRARALACLPAGPDSREFRWEVLMQLTRERRLSGDVEGALASLHQALSTARRLSDPDRIRRTVRLLGSVTFWNWRHFGDVDDETVQELRTLLAGDLADEDRAELLGTLAVELFFSGDPEVCVPLAREAVALARRTGDPRLLARTLNNGMVASFFPGLEGEKLAAAEETLALPGLSQHEEAIALMQRGYLRYRLGDVPGWEADYERAGWLVPRLGLPELEGQYLYGRVGPAIVRGDFDAARELIELADESFSRTTVWGIRFVRAVLTLQVARLTGTVDRVIGPMVDAAMADSARMGRWPAVVALVEAGDERTARSLLTRWGLGAVPSHRHWASEWEWAEAGEAAIALDLPIASEIYRLLDGQRDGLTTLGSGGIVLGPAAALLSRLARHLGDDERADRDAAEARALTARVEAALGRPPAFTLRP